MCHKCGEGMSASNFIKAIDPALHEEMRMEIYRPDRKEEVVVPQPVRKVPVAKDKLLAGLKKVSELPATHPCLVYIQSRMIPEDDLFYVEKFFTWASTVNSERFKIPPYDEGRLLIPLRNRKGDITAFQGRKLSGDGPKYISVTIDETAPLVWGLDRIRENRHIIVLEGPLDAMFLPNAIACCGSDITTDLTKLGIPLDQFIIVYDNEPRNKHTVKKMKKAIVRDFSICIWPENIDEKDVNDMVLTKIEYGLDEASYLVWTTIKDHVHKGLSAELSLSTWAKTK